MYEPISGIQQPPRFCSRCGAPLSGRFCARCGMEIQPSAPLGSPSFPGGGLPGQPLYQHEPPPSQFRPAPRRKSGGGWVLGAVIAGVLLIFVVGGAFLILLASQTGTYEDYYNRLYGYNDSPYGYYDDNPYEYEDPYGYYDPYDDYGIYWDDFNAVPLLERPAGNDTDEDAPQTEYAFTGSESRYI